MTKLLVVEDQKYFLDLLKDWLTAEGYSLDCAETGPAALMFLKHNEYDMVILDVNLPGVSGIEICRSFRQKGGTTPIIFLTVNQTIDDKELGFDAGADDYLSKPFQMKELTARIKAVLKRSGGMRNEPVLTAGAISLNSAEHTVKVEDKDVDLQPKEFALLEFLMRHPNRVFSSEALLQRIWPNASQISADTVRSHITRIRQKLGAAAADSLVTVHGVGYKFVK
jgi:DNA-binding response OmpR family regulator